MKGHLTVPAEPPRGPLGGARWEPPFYRLAVHTELEYAMRLLMDGVECAIVVGDRGLGKSYSVGRIVEKLRAEEAARVMEDIQYAPREIVSYHASATNGTKTSLIQLLDRLLGEPLPAGIRRAGAPIELVELAANRLRARNVRLVCVDEAQMINPHNLDLLRQVWDHAKDELDFPTGLLLIGNEGLRENLVSIRQEGQRFTRDIVFPRITAQDVGADFHRFHPDLPALCEEMGKKRWNALVEDVFRSVAGSFRRLRTGLVNAHELARRLSRTIDEEIVRAAFDKLSAEF